MLHHCGTSDALRAVHLLQEGPQPEAGVAASDAAASPVHEQAQRMQRHDDPTLVHIVEHTAEIAGLIFAAIIIIKKMMFGDPVAGYPSLVVLITFIGGIQLLALGIIGEYLGRVFNETKNRPLYLIKDIKSSKFRE